MDVNAWNGFFLEQNQFTGPREHNDGHFGSLNCWDTESLSKTFSPT